MADESRVVETGTEQLLCRVEEGVAVVTLNRPEARNALSMELKRALLRVVEEMAGANDVGCLLLCGEGNK